MTTEVALYAALWKFEPNEGDPRRKWRWRQYNRSGHAIEESEPFEFLSDCIDDARDHGYC